MRQLKTQSQYFVSRLILTGLVFFIVLTVTAVKKTAPSPSMNYHANIANLTQENPNFRRVLFTSSKTQLVAMTIPPGGEVGEEIHQSTEQTLFFLSGTGEGLLGEETFPISPGDVVVVTAGTKHNFKNTGSKALKLYTLYTPPHHLNDRVHPAKQDADTDSADAAFGK